MSIVTRFAPSPTGYLHLGHAFSALTAWRRAREAGGRFLLRLEDIDTARCRPEFAAAVLEDLAWLGIDWDGEVRVQSRHLSAYRAALDRLAALGLLYPCFCTRADIQQSAAAPHAPDGTAVYPGTCRRL
jgi:glutamyl-Q tRNA(Asp) synthetase